MMKINSKWALWHFKNQLVMTGRISVYVYVRNIKRIKKITHMKLLTKFGYRFMRHVRRQTDVKINLQPPV